MVFANLTVHENLMMGAHLQRDKAVIQQELELVFKTFPRLKEREGSPARSAVASNRCSPSAGR